MREMEQLEPIKKKEEKSIAIAVRLSL